METYPELVEKLLPIKLALEWLEGANHQIEQQWGNKDFSQLGSLIMRDDSGLQGDDPLQGEDPYLNLNQDLVRAFSALNLRRLSRHMNTLLSRDMLLSRAAPHKTFQGKTLRKAKKGGRVGGAAKAEKCKPLYENIERLFLRENAKSPRETLKFYASQIENEVRTFIEKDPEPYKHIGSGQHGSRDYHDFILRRLGRINKSRSIE